MKYVIQEAKPLTNSCMKSTHIPCLVRLGEIKGPMRGGEVRSRSGLNGTMCGALLHLVSLLLHGNTPSTSPNLRRSALLFIIPPPEGGGFQNGPTNRFLHWR